jgi:predicted RecA/RadA family phage recombinase
MARNEVFRDADHLSLPVPDGTKAGSPVLIGGTLVGVTETDEGTGGNADNFATVWRKGAHKLSVTGAVTAVGDPVYITSGNALNRTASGNTLFGYALELKGAPAGVIRVAIARV